MMIETSTIDNAVGSTAYDSAGDKIGKVGQVYVDPGDGHAVWASVITGFFGTSESFVPLENATLDGEGLRVQYDKAFVKGAPRVDPDGDLSTEDQEALYEYYGMSAGSSGGFTTGTDTARLRTHVVTDQQNVTVPVQREEVRLEREPITDANVGDALSGPDLSEEEHEVTLSEERDTDRRI